MIPLPEVSPFMTQVMLLIDGRGSIDDAIAMLLEAEEACGLRLVGPPFDIDDPLTLPRSIEPMKTRLHAVQQCMTSCSPMRMSPAIERILEQRLFCLLSRTCLLLASDDFCNDHALLLSEGYVLPAPTFREWADYLARWANTRSEFVVPSIPGKRHRASQWTYVDFYSHWSMSMTFIQYDKFAKMARQILTTKTQREWE